MCVCVCVCVCVCGKDDSFGGAYTDIEYRCEEII